MSDVRDMKNKKPIAMVAVIRNVLRCISANADCIIVALSLRLEVWGGKERLSCCKILIPTAAQSFWLPNLSFEEIVKVYVGILLV